MPGGKELLVAGNDRAGVGVWIQPLEGAARALDLDGLVVSGAYGYEISVAATGAIAFAALARGQAGRAVRDELAAAPSRAV